MFCFAFEYHLQYELPKPPSLFVILPNLQKYAVLRVIPTKVTL